MLVTSSCQRNEAASDTCFSIHVRNSLSKKWSSISYLCKSHKQLVRGNEAVSVTCKHVRNSPSEKWSNVSNLCTSHKQPVRGNEAVSVTCIYMYQKQLVREPNQNNLYRWPGRGKECQPILVGHSRHTWRLGREAWQKNFNLNQIPAAFTSDVTQ